MTIEPVGKKAADGQIGGLPLDNPAIMDAIRKGNIHDVHKLLADYGLTAADFEKFAVLQHGKYLNLLQDESIYEGEAAVPPPDIEMGFSAHDQSNILTKEDQLTFKAMSIGGVKNGKAMSGETRESVQAHIDAWEDFRTNVLEPRIIEMQFMQQMESKRSELERELQKLEELAKSGTADPVILILAIAKYKMGENGLAFAQLGFQTKRLNDQSTAAYEALKGGENPITAQQNLKESSQGLTFVMNDMQRVAQNVTSIMESTKSLVDGVMKNREDIIRNQGRVAS